MRMDCYSMGISTSQCVQVKHCLQKWLPPTKKIIRSNITCITCCFSFRFFKKTFYPHIFFLFYNFSVHTNKVLKAKDKGCQWLTKKLTTNYST